MLIDPEKFYYDKQRVDKGLYIIDWFNGDIDLWGRNDYERAYPKFENQEIYAYGVVDTPQQFKEKFGELLQNDPRPFVVCFTHVEKDEENKWRGGGWRWHKWGDYYGTGTPTCEYLDDEDDFADGVYCFHIYLADNVTVVNCD